MVFRKDHRTKRNKFIDHHGYYQPDKVKQRKREEICLGVHQNAIRNFDRIPHVYQVGSPDNNCDPLILRPLSGVTTRKDDTVRSTCGSILAKHAYFG